MWRILSLLLCTFVIGIQSKEIPVKKRVCIIGAGPSGLLSAKAVSRLEHFEPIVFERNPDVGGQWFYSENPAADIHGLPAHSGVYKYMRSNFPKRLLAFPDYQDIHGENRSYLSHDGVFEYLKNYTEHFDIRRFIQFDTLVEEVDFADNCWKVKVKNLNTYEENDYSCAAIMVCNGNYFKPYIPKIPGIENFPGRVLHSHNYRRPEEFTNQTVALLGALISGIDIAVEISPFVRKIYLSNRHDKHKSELPENLEQVPGIVAANYTELILSNGSRIHADSLIYCTGYEYFYPFLKPSTGIVVEEGKYIHPLYKHLVNIEHPTMAILAVPHPGLPWQVAYAQANYFASILDGKLKLPPKQKMLRESALPPGVPKKKAHYMFEKVLDYYKELVQAGHAESLPEFWEPAFKIFVKDFTENPISFKDRNLYLHANGSVELS